MGKDPLLLCLGRWLPERSNQEWQGPSSGFLASHTCKRFNLPFPPISSPRTFPTISVKTMARELLMGTARVRSE